jgi:hypothetical protein
LVAVVALVMDLMVVLAVVLVAVSVHLKMVQEDLVLYQNLVQQVLMDLQ